MNNLLAITSETTFLIPICVLLGASILLTVLTVVFKIGFIPSLVIEIIIGIILKQLFYDSSYLVEYGNITEVMYTIGFILIMFISGFDNNLGNMRDDKKTSDHHINVKKLSILILICVYIVSLIISLFFITNYENKVGGITLLTITISSTFAGVVVPLIKEEQLSDTVFGNFIICFSTISELTSIVLLTIFMFVMEFSIVRITAYLGLILLFIIIWFINKLFRNAPEKIKTGLTYLPVRTVFVILAGCVILCEVAGGEYILGAFLLGMFLKKIGFSERVMEEIESFSFGLFTPMFFIIAGTKIDIRVFIENPKWLIAVALLVIGFILSKLPLLYLYRWYNKKSTALAISLISCTLIVGLATSHLGTHHQIFSIEFGECIVAASLITCILTSIFFEASFPLSLNKINEEEIKEFYGSEEIV